MLVLKELAVLYGLSFYVDIKLNTSRKSEQYSLQIYGFLMMNLNLYVHVYSVWSYSRMLTSKINLYPLRNWLMESCWSKSPASRPSCQEVYSQLQGIRHHLVSLSIRHHLVSQSNWHHAPIKSEYQSTPDL